MIQLRPQQYSNLHALYITSTRFNTNSLNIYRLSKPWSMYTVQSSTPGQNCSRTLLDNKADYKPTTVAATTIFNKGIYRRENICHYNIIIFCISNNR